MMRRREFPRHVCFVTVVMCQSDVLSFPPLLQPGEVSYHYVIDGQVVLSPDEGVETHPERGAVHKVSG